MGVTVLIAIRNEILRRGLSSTLATSERPLRVLEASDAASARRLTRDESVDVVIAGTDLAQDGPEPNDPLRGWVGDRLVMVAQDDRPDSLRRAERSGARALLGTESSGRELERAVEAVLARERYVSPALMRRAEGRSCSRRLPSPRHRGRLTEREHLVLRLIGEGRSNREIAEFLGLSSRTVDTHRSRLMRKLDLRKTADLVRLAVREGLVEA